jgi:hypothetical protein
MTAFFWMWPAVRKIEIIACIPGPIYVFIPELLTRLACLSCHNSFLATYFVQCENISNRQSRANERYPALAAELFLKTLH